MGAKCTDDRVRFIFVIAVWRAKEAESHRVKYWRISLAILAALSGSVALADDFKTIDGKEYKNVEVSRVEPDGIVVITFSCGIVKIPFNELSPEIKKKYGYNPQTAAAYSAEQSERQAALAQQRKSDGEPALDVEGSPVSSSQINLYWTDNANNEDRFELQRADGGSGATPQCGRFVTIQPSLPPNTIGFNDTGLPASHWYCYRVRAFNRGGNSSWSNSVSVRVQNAPKKNAGQEKPCLIALMPRTGCSKTSKYFLPRSSLLMATLNHDAS